MAGGSGSEDEKGMCGFIFAQGCRKCPGVLPKFYVGHTDKKHVVLPLRGRQRADGIPQDAQIRLTKVSNEVGGRI